MKNTADVTGGKPIAVSLQSISGVSAINALVAFYDIHGGKRKVLLLFCPGEKNVITVPVTVRIYVPLSVITFFSRIVVCSVPHS
jgi:hypothetical protein